MGFLQGVLVSPVSRSCIVLGQALGATTLALVQGIIFLILAPAAGVSLSVSSILWMVLVMFLVSFGLTNLGLVIAWRLESTQGFHAVMNLILLPMWVLSGAFFPMTGVPSLIEWVMRVNPLTYGMAALRRCLYLGNPEAAGRVPGLAAALGITVLFGILAFVAATDAARRSTV